MCRNIAVVIYGHRQLLENIYGAQTSSKGHEDSSPVWLLCNQCLMENKTNKVTPLSVQFSLARECYDLKRQRFNSKSKPSNKILI